jgi:hypothetical protein
MENINAETQQNLPSRDKWIHYRHINPIEKAVIGGALGALSLPGDLRIED